MTCDLDLYIEPSGSSKHNAHERLIRKGIHCVVSVRKAASPSEQRSGGWDTSRIATKESLAVSEVDVTYITLNRIHLGNPDGWESSIYSPQR